MYIICYFLFSSSSGSCCYRQHWWQRHLLRVVYSIWSICYELFIGMVASQPATTKVHWPKVLTYIVFSVYCVNASLCTFPQRCEGRNWVILMTLSSLVVCSSSSNNQRISAKYCAAKKWWMKPNRIYDHRQWWLLETVLIFLLLSAATLHCLAVRRV